MGRTIFPSVELSWGSGSRLKVFCLTRLLLPSSLVKRDQAVVGAFLFLESVPVVVSRFLTSSVLRLACVKQEENRGKRPPRRSLAPEAAGGPPSSSCILWDPPAAPLSGRAPSGCVPSLRARGLQLWSMRSFFHASKVAACLWPQTWWSRAL